MIPTKCQHKMIPTKCQHKMIPTKCQHKMIRVKEEQRWIESTTVFGKINLSTLLWVEKSELMFQSCNHFFTFDCSGWHHLCEDECSNTKSDDLNGQESSNKNVYVKIEIAND